MKQFFKKNILILVSGNVSKLVGFQIIEKIFPLLSLWIVSILFNVKVLDNFGLAIISVSTVVAWSTSGVGVATTKATVVNKLKEMNSLYSLSGIFSILTILVFIIINLISQKFSTQQFIIIIFSGYFAAISVLKKSYYIAIYNWRILYTSYIISLISSILVIVLLSIFKVNLPELGIFIFYFLLSLFMKAKFFTNLKCNSNVFQYFINELGPLYFTGIISGSVVFILTLIATSQSDVKGVAAYLAIGFQIITILQFLPMSINRLLFITIAKGEKIKGKYEIFRLSFFTVVIAIPLFIMIPFLGPGYDELSGFTYILLVLASIASTFSTFFGNILVAKGKTKVWTLITLVGTIIGLSVVFFPFNIKPVNLVFITATCIYSIQFILGILYNEKFRLLHI